MAVTKSVCLAWGRGGAGQKVGPEERGSGALPTQRGDESEYINAIIHEMDRRSEHLPSTTHNTPKPPKTLNNPKNPKP